MRMKSDSSLSREWHKSAAESQLGHYDIAPISPLDNPDSYVDRALREAMVYLSQSLGIQGVSQSFGRIPINDHDPNCENKTKEFLKKVKKLMLSVGFAENEFGINVLSVNFVPDEDETKYRLSEERQYVLQQPTSASQKFSDSFVNSSRFLHPEAKNNIQQEVVRYIAVKTKIKPFASNEDKPDDYLRRLNSIVSKLWNSLERPKAEKMRSDTDLNDRRLINCTCDAQAA